MLASDPLYITPEDYIAAEEISPIADPDAPRRAFPQTPGYLTMKHRTQSVRTAFPRRAWERD